MNKLTVCRLREDLDNGSDHYPSETSLSISPQVSPHVTKPLWRKADKAVLSQRARELDLLPRNYDNCEDIDAGVERLVRWIKESVAQHIPLSKPVSFFVPWWSSELTQLVRNARRARRWHRGGHVLKLGGFTWRHSVPNGRQSEKQKLCILSRLWPRLHEGEEASGH